MTNNSSNAAMPPLFSYAGDNFDQDFDIGLLSEYLFDSNPPQQSKQGQASSGENYGNSDYMNFENEDELNFENDDDGKNIYNKYCFTKNCFLIYYINFQRIKLK